MRWPWDVELDAPIMDPERLEAGDEIEPCPNCGRNVPAFSIAIGRNVVKRNGVRRVVMSGERLACMGCGEHYATGPSGPFKVHPNALPRIGPEPVRTTSPPQAKPEELEDRPLPPLGLKRP